MLANSATFASIKTALIITVSYNGERQMREHYSNEKQQTRAEIAELTEQYLASGKTVEQFPYLSRSAVFSADSKYGTFEVQSEKRKGVLP